MISAVLSVLCVLVSFGCTSSCPTPFTAVELGHLLEQLPQHGPAEAQLLQKIITASTAEAAELFERELSSCCLTVRTNRVARPQVFEVTQRLPVSARGS